MKGLLLFAVLVVVLLLCIPQYCAAEVTDLRIAQGDTVYLPYPMLDSCYFIIEARKYKTNWPINDPVGFENPYWDVDWLWCDEIFEGGYAGSSEDTLILKVQILSSPSPTPYEVGTIEILGAGWYGIDRISVVAIPKGPDEICETEGDPMHPRRGDMFIEASDLLLTGRGLDVNFSRYYSSVPFENPDTLEDLAWTVPFGFGWTHSFNNFLTLEGGVPFTGSNWCIV